MNKEAQKLWTREQSRNGLNIREMRAVLFSLRAFQVQLRDKVVQVLSDNISTVANINFQGRRSYALTKLTAEIWIEAFKNNVNI